MTIAAQAILHRVVDALQDPTSVKWTIGELARYLNDGQREVAMYRPDSLVVDESFVCVAGAKQAMPAGGSKLIDVIGLRSVSRKLMDSVKPTWQADTQSATIRNYVYDPEDPLVFYTYPPAKDGTTLSIVYAGSPTDITEPADGQTYAAITGNCSLADQFVNALQDYILYRAWKKDAEHASNLQLASAHYSAFANALGIQLKALITATAKATASP